MKKLLMLALLLPLSGCAGTYLNQPSPLLEVRVKDGATVMTLKKYDGYYIGVTEGNLITGGDWPPAHIRKEKLIKAIEEHSKCKVTSAEFDPVSPADLAAKIECPN